MTTRFLYDGTETIGEFNASNGGAALLVRSEAEPRAIAAATRWASTATALRYGRKLAPASNGCRLDAGESEGAIKA